MTGAVLAHWDAYELEFRIRSGEADALRETILPELVEADIQGVILAAGGDSHEHLLGHDDPLIGSLAMLDAAQGALERAGKGVVLARAWDDISAARAAGTPWFLLALEGCRPLRGELSVLHAIYRLGVRCIGLSWNGRNEAADGVGVLSPGGLTAFGRQVVAEMNRLGMLIDVSHLADPGLDDVLALSAAPVCASHSNARALMEHRRNLRDDQIIAIGNAGGVVGLNFLATFLSESDATVDDVVKQIEHIASLIGFDKVVVGGDFTYGPWRASLEGRRDFQGVVFRVSQQHPIARPGELPKLRRALLDRGHDMTSVDNVMGGNMLRLLERVLPATNLAARQGERLVP